MNEGANHVIPGSPVLPLALTPCHNNCSVPCSKHVRASFPSHEGAADLDRARVSRFGAVLMNAAACAFWPTTLADDLISLLAGAPTEAADGDLRQALEELDAQLGDALGPDRVRVRWALPARAEPACGAGLRRALDRVTEHARQRAAEAGTVTIEIRRRVLNRRSGLTLLGLASDAYLELRVTVGTCERRLQAPGEPRRCCFAMGHDGQSAEELQMECAVVCRHTGTRQHPPLVDNPPAVSLLVPEPNLPAAPEPHRGARRSILVAEDEELVRNLLSGVLSRAGYAVVSAANGEEALRILKENVAVFDLLVADVVMPRVNGLELAGEFRRRNPATPVLLTSGYSDNTLLSKTLPTLPESAFLAKPFTATELTQAVGRMLAEAKAKATGR